MLSLSAADEKELEQWRNKQGRCRLPEERLRRKPSLETACERLPKTLAAQVRSKLGPDGPGEALALNLSEITAVEADEGMSRREIMVMLLDLASAMASTDVPGEYIGSVAEGKSGAVYLGSPLSWKGEAIRFSVHGVQAAILNAVGHGEKGITQVMTETAPCACCRQFMRELYGWREIKILEATHGPLSLQKGAVREMSLPLEGLRGDGVKARLMDEARRPLNLGRAGAGILIKRAAMAAASAYAPYSHNNAGVSLKTKHGRVHQGGYIETRESVAGVTAVEAALVDLFLSGTGLSDIVEIVLVETKGSATQFSATQKLASALGNVPFRYVMAT